MKNKFTIRWLLGCLIFFSSACTHNKQEHSLQQSEEEKMAKENTTEKLQAKLTSVKKLIEAGGDFRVLDMHGNTPLLLSRKWGNTECDVYLSGLHDSTR